MQIYLKARGTVIPHKIKLHHLKNSSISTNSTRSLPTADDNMCPGCFIMGETYKSTLLDKQKHSSLHKQRRAERFVGFCSSVLETCHPLERGLRCVTLWRGQEAVIKTALMGRCVFIFKQDSQNLNSSVAQLLTISRTKPIQFRSSCVTINETPCS
ncbi:hypothetical protein J6590_027046 [Homalodisca vitripennis]|nr:hypothetical protein J6590_027046 [Homalodisca vitripennis]